jgi:hypothetical protein
LCFDRSGPIIRTFSRLINPIASSVRIIRDIVGAGKETKFFVSVDEIGLAAMAGSEFSTAQAFGTLAWFVDTGGKAMFHLSASVYGCLALEEFTGNSRRSLFLQTLSPIFPVMNTGNIHLLPPLLQPFVDKT